MPSARVKKGDVVVVVSERSDYAGRVGTVESLTKTRLSAHVLFEDGKRATVRISSLEVRVDRGGVRSPTTLELTAAIRQLREEMAEIRQLREEMAEMKALMMRLEKLLVDDGGYVRDDEVMVLVRSDKGADG